MQYGKRRTRHGVRGTLGARRVPLRSRASYEHRDGLASGSAVGREPRYPPRSALGASAKAGGRVAAIGSYAVEAKVSAPEVGRASPRARPADQTAGKRPVRAGLASVGLADGPGLVGIR